MGENRIEKSSEAVARLENAQRICNEVLKTLHLKDDVTVSLAEGKEPLGFEDEKLRREADEMLKSILIEGVESHLAMVNHSLSKIDEALKSF